MAAATPPEKSALRGRILHAAAGMFALKGFDATGMEDLCLAVGCSKGGLYHHFPTKERLFASVIERCRDADGAQERRVLVEAWALASRSPIIRKAVRAADPERNAPGLLQAALARGGNVREQLSGQPFPTAFHAMLVPTITDEEPERHTRRTS